MSLFYIREAVHIYVQIMCAHIDIHTYTTSTLLIMTTQPALTHCDPAQNILIRRKEYQHTKQNIIKKVRPQ